MHVRLWFCVIVGVLASARVFVSGCACDVIRLVTVQDLPCFCFIVRPLICAVAARQEPIIPRQILWRIVLAALVVMSGTLFVFIREAESDGCVVLVDAFC